MDKNVNDSSKYLPSEIAQEAQQNKLIPIQSFRDTTRLPSVSSYSLIGTLEIILLAIVLIYAVIKKSARSDILVIGLSVGLFFFSISYALYDIIWNVNDIFSTSVIETNDLYLVILSAAYKVFWMTLASSIGVIIGFALLAKHISWGVHQNDQQ